jgi:hypothetical protein
MSGSDGLQTGMNSQWERAIGCAELLESGWAHDGARATDTLDPSGGATPEADHDP